MRAHPATRSRRIYIRVARSGIALFKFILESYDNLAYLSVIDSRAALLQMVFGPEQEAEVLEFLAGMADMAVIEFAPRPEMMQANATLESAVP